MANGVNKVILIGNLGRDPEVRHTQGGTAVSNLRVACTERRKVNDNYEDVTEWVDVVAWGKTAENVAQYLEKGRQIYVEGRLQTRKWEKDGVDRWSTEVHAHRVVFLSGDNKRGETKKKEEPKAGSNPKQGDGFYDEGLPY